MESGQRGLVPPEAETAMVFVELLGPAVRYKLTLLHRASVAV